MLLEPYDSYYESMSTLYSTADFAHSITVAQDFQLASPPRFLTSFHIIHVNVCA